MAIGPPRLQSVTAHQIEPDKLKTFVGVSHVWTRDAAQHIRFTTTRCARTRATQHFEFQKRFGAVVPRNGELVSDLLDVVRLQTHDVSSAFWPHPFAKNRRADAHQRRALLRSEEHTSELQSQS